MSNDPAKLAHFAGFCVSRLWLSLYISWRPLLSDKSIQSAGAAGMWAADAHHQPWVGKYSGSFIMSHLLCRFINIFISTWVLLVAGILFALPMVYYRVKDHTDPEDEALYVSLSAFSLPIDNQFRAHTDDHSPVSPPEAEVKDWWALSIYCNCWHVKYDLLVMSSWLIRMALCLCLPIRVTRISYNTLLSW